MGINDTGGGSTYPFTVAPTMADVTVSTRADLETELANASYGDVVYIDGSASIYVGSNSERLTVPKGVTLASDRGLNGSNGALVYTDATWGTGAEGMIEAKEDARVTGLQVEGSNDQSVRWMAYDSNYEMSGINAIGPNVEIDNCEGRYFGHSLIRGGNGAHIHHNYLHHANMEGLGYGVMTDNSPDLPIVEYNQFEHWRHAVADGGAGGGYIFRYNDCLGPAIGHAIDQHDNNGTAGTTMEIYNNYCDVVNHDQDGTQIQTVAIREEPEDIARIRHNHFYNPDPPPANPSHDWSDDHAIIQVNVTSWTNIDWNHNHYGSTSPSQGNIGTP